MHQKFTHYNPTCLRCIYLNNTETLEIEERLFFDEQNRAYEMVITCALNHCIDGSEGKDETE